MSLSEHLNNLREIGTMARGLYLGVKRIQVELHTEHIEIPEDLKRTLHRLDITLDEFASDLEEMTR